MSIDLMVYAESNQPMTRDALRSGLSRLGWEVVFLQGDYSMTPAEGDVIGDYEFILGCPSGSPILSVLQNIIASKDRDALDEMGEEMPVGGCALSVSENEYDDQCVPTEIRSDYLHAYKNAKTHYYIRTSAGRCSFSFDLQYAIWWAVGEATGGLLEDPQSGDFFFSHERSADQLPSTLRALEKQSERGVLGVFRRIMHIFSK